MKMIFRYLENQRNGENLEKAIKNDLKRKKPTKLTKPCREQLNIFKKYSNCIQV